MGHPLDDTAFALTGDAPQMLDAYDPARFPFPWEKLWEEALARWPFRLPDLGEVRRWLDTGHGCPSFTSRQATQAYVDAYQEVADALLSALTLSKLRHRHDCPYGRDLERQARNMPKGIRLIAVQRLMSCDCDVVAWKPPA